MAVRATSSEREPPGAIRIGGARELWRARQVESRLMPASERSPPVEEPEPAPTPSSVRGIPARGRPAASSRAGVSQGRSENQTMRTLFRSGSLLVVIAIALLLSSYDNATAQTIEDGIQTAENRLTEAKRSRLNLIAPRTFAEAETELANAKQRFERGGKIDDIQRRLDKINDRLGRCDALQEIGDLLLRDCFVARQDAVSANAPEFAAELWTEAEKITREAGRRIEDGDQNGAREQASRAGAVYRDAELLAIRTDILGSAKTERDLALAAKADERASVTMSAAEKDLASAEKILEGDRYMKARALELAESARLEFRHAARIAAMWAEIDEDRRSRPEAIVRSYESQIDDIAQVFGYDPVFSEGVEPVTEQIVAAAKSLADDRRQLVAQVTGLQSEIDGLHNDLALLQDRDRTLQQKERYDRKLSEVRAIFGADQADVLLGEDELIIRLYGLSFPVGSSEIRPENFGLLTHVQRALRTFPAAAVTIEGHTDSQGDESMNQSLSDRRAEAVRAYLLANMDVEAERLTARGYGESRPIANNEIESGRAQNRRIDVVIHLEAPNL